MMADTQRARLEAAGRGVVNPEPPQTITLFCRQCCEPFETPVIVAVCPGCARYCPIEVGGEMSGT